ncbi:hypothetical protein [Flavobacterium sp. HJSW_4]|uniref:ATP-binding protein n=1 Tax=Flavobacterium sp. HJSW_4 TaxID=3344660 RepID=UPI0035F24D61
MSCKKEKATVAKKTDNTAEVKRLTIIADKYFDDSDNKNAYNTYRKILAIADTVKDRIDYVDALISIGYLYQSEGDYTESEAVVTKILPHLKHLKKPRFAWNTYNLLGCSYLRTKDFENAILYFNKAYNLNTKEWRKLNAQGNIALTYMQQKDYNKAIKMYLKLTTEGFYAENKKTNTLKDYELREFAIMIDNLGICYFTIDNPKSLKYFNEALEIRLKTKDLENLPLSYSNLCRYYSKTNAALAKKYGETGYKIACDMNNYQGKKFTLYSLIESSTGNDLEKYSNLYVKFNDSISEIRLKQKNLFSNMKYNFKKDKDENLELKAQKTEDELDMQRERNRSYISYVIIFISIISLVFIVFYVTTKAKKESNNEVFKNEMRISEKLQFELEKEIDKISVFTEDNDLEKEENKEIFLSQLNNIYSKTRNISRENSKIITDENFEKALKEMISGYTSSKLNIIINGLDTFSWLKIDRVKKITVFRVLQEIFDQNKIINNASLASITFKKEEKNILITYTNNGTEFQDRNVNLNKIFANIENRLKSVKGFLEISSNENERFKIFIKLPL